MTAHRRRRSPTSHSPLHPVRPSASSAAPVPAKRRSSTCSCGFMTPRADAFSSSETTSAPMTTRRCARCSASCRRNPFCSAAPSATTSAGASRTPPMRKSAPRWRRRRPPNLSTGSPADWTHRLNRAAGTSPAASASGSALPARWSGARLSSSSTTAPPPSTLRRTPACGKPSGHRPQTPPSF